MGIENDMCHKYFFFQCVAIRDCNTRLARPQFSVTKMTVIALVSIDTSFMYIITCLGIVKLYQTRHPDIVANAHLVFTGFAVIIFLAMIGVVSG